MKKAMQIIVAIALLGSLVLCFAACTKQESSSDTVSSAVKQYVTGRYELEKVTYADGTISTGEVLAQAEQAMGDMYVELFSDGTAQLALLGQTRDMAFSDDKLWQINSEKFSYDFSVSGGKVYLTQDGDTYLFVKR